VLKTSQRINLLRNKFVRDVGAWAGSIWFRIGTGSICECGNKPSGSIIRGKFLYLLLKKDSDPLNKQASK
jgi:hypothetical protein